jgi:hypothetical protein
MGVLAVGEWLQRFLHWAESGAAAATRPAVAVALALVVGIAVAGATAAQSVPRNARTVGLLFNTSGDERLVSPSKLQFLRTVARIVPASAIVADNPFDGTAFLFAMSGIRVLFPQLSPSSDKDVSYLAHNLVQLGQDPRACALVRSYDVDYMVVAPDDVLTKQAELNNPGQVREELNYFAGLDYVVSHSGFRLVASADGGQLRLYKITICQQANQAAPVEATSPGSG